MILILSPTKTFRNVVNEQGHSYKKLAYHEQTMQLIEKLKGYSIEELQKMMKVSKEIASCNFERYQSFNNDNVKGDYACDYYYGEAFKALDSVTMTKEGRSYMQSHLKILSGLYGLLSAMDVIKPYRLEMNTKFSKEPSEQLYVMWKQPLTKGLEKALEQTSGEKVLINLASEEYTKAISFNEIEKVYSVCNIHFKVKKGEDYKVVSMYAKKARGLMARYICEHQLNTVDEIKGFNLEGYTYEPSLSDEKNLVFIK